MSKNRVQIIGTLRESDNLSVIKEQQMETECQIFILNITSF